MSTGSDSESLLWCGSRADSIDDDLDLRQIFCGNISFQSEDEALYRLFRPFGIITQVCIVLL
jgi:hypothetical protein